MYVSVREAVLQAAGYKSIVEDLADVGLDSVESEKERKDILKKDVEHLKGLLG